MQTIKNLQTRFKEHIYINHFLFAKKIPELHKYLIISRLLFAKKIPCNNRNMNRKDKALAILKESLTRIPHELSELDCNLSTKTD